MIRLAAFCLLLATSLGAQAADWTTQPGSSLNFSASYDGEAFAGSFGKFTPLVRFDPARPTDGLIDVRIALASAGTKNDERDETLRGGEFFNVAKFAEARYVASKFRALGGQRYAADGNLTLRGITKPVTLAFTWTPGARPVLDGTAIVRRLDFQVGTGDWADVGVLPNEVQVKTHLVLAPAMVKMTVPKALNPVTPAKAPAAPKK
jgi:polyisoprenoid-binding protein YceI